MMDLPLDTIGSSDLIPLGSQLREGVYTQSSVDMALQLASFAGFVDVAQCLIEDGRADMSTASEYEGFTPLHLACRHGRLEVVRYLAAKGGQWLLQILDKIDGRTPYINACLQGHVDIVRHLIIARHQVDVNQRYGHFGRTPLHAATSGDNDLEMTTLLLRHGAEVDAKCDNGQTPLHWACRRGALRIVECLLNNGANVNCRDNEGDTPLFLVCRRKWDNPVGILHCIIQHMLVHSPAELGGDQGARALRIAQEQCNFEMIPFLETARERASPNAKLRLVHFVLYNIGFARPMSANDQSNGN